MSDVESVLIFPNRWRIVSTVQSLVFIVRCVAMMRTERHERKRVWGHLLVVIFSNLGTLRISAWQERRQDFYHRLYLFCLLYAYVTLWFYKEHSHLYLLLSSHVPHPSFTGLKYSGQIRMCTQYLWKQIEVRINLQTGQRTEDFFLSVILTLDTYMYQLLNSYPIRVAQKWMTSYPMSL